MKISILNFFSSLSDAIELAAECDSLTCFERFWVGEHHATGQIADPLTFVALASAYTKSIRIGTGATSLVFRNPYIVAETVLSISGMFSNRIDIGVSKSMATPSKEIFQQLMLGQDAASAIAQFEMRVRVLRDTLVEHRMHQGGGNRGAAMYLMATGLERAQLAGELGIGCVGSFHHGGDVESMRNLFQRYRQAFRASILDQPYCIIVVSGFIGTDPTEVKRVRLEDSARQPLGSFSGKIHVFEIAAIGVAKLRHLASLVEADEIMFLCVGRDCLHCYASLAAAWRDS